MPDCQRQGQLGAKLGCQVIEHLPELKGNRFAALVENANDDSEQGFQRVGEELLRTEQEARLQEETLKVRSEMDANMEGLRQERDQAQAQLSEFINQHQFEKESLEGKLQH